MRRQFGQEEPLLSVLNDIDEPHPAKFADLLKRGRADLSERASLKARRFYPDIPGEMHSVVFEIDYAKDLGGCCRNV